MEKGTSRTFYACYIKKVSQEEEIISIMQTREKKKLKIHFLFRACSAATTYANAVNHMNKN